MALLERIGELTRTAYVKVHWSALYVRMIPVPLELIGPRKRQVVRSLRDNSADRVLP